MRIITAFSIFFLFLFLHISHSEENESNRSKWSKRIQNVLDITKPLEFERGNRLPLYLWPAMDAGNLDDESAELLVEELNSRGIGLICSWTPKNSKESLSKALTIAKAQKKLGVPDSLSKLCAVRSKPAGS